MPNTYDSHFRSITVLAKKTAIKLSIRSGWPMPGFKLIISGALCLTAENIGESSPYYLFILIELQHRFVYCLHTLMTRRLRLLRLSHNFSVISPSPT